MHNPKSDIEKYLNGELTPAEMHALEKKALSDPFIAEALEGGGTLETDDFSQDMQQLHAALNERVGVKKGRVIPLWNWAARIAAGVVLLVASTYIIFSLTDNKKEENQLAQNKQQPSIPSPVVADTIKKEKEKDKDSATANEQYLSLAEKPQETKPAPKSQRANKKFLTRDEGDARLSSASAGAASEPGVSAEETEQIREDVFRKKIAAGDVAPAAAQDSTKVITFFNRSEEAKDNRVANNANAERGNPYTVREDESGKKENASRKRKLKMNKAPSSDGVISRDEALPVVNAFDADGKNIVRGRVVSTEDGSGIPGVNVLIKGTETGTITDVEGNYQITLPDASATLVYSFIGLESTERMAFANQLSNVDMKEDVSQLSEVVVTGYGDTDEVSTEPSTFDMAAPAGGRKLFKKYLEETVTYPQVALDNKIEGKVTVSFVVDAYGKLTDFKVVKGIGYGCDEEVIRLIREGPAWTPMKRDDEPIRGKVKVRMRFSLPGKKK